MALIQKISPVGVDCNIAKIQKYLYDNISWTATNRYESYQRAYKNETNNNVEWQVFVKDNDYQEIFYDDRFFATSFFVVSDRISVNKKRKSFDFSIIFQIDVKKLYPLVLHRADEEAHNEVMNLIESAPFGRNFVNLSKGIRNVYSELGYGANKFEDMQPCHVFRADFSNVEIC